MRPVCPKRGVGVLTKCWLGLARMLFSGQRERRGGKNAGKCVRANAFLFLIFFVCFLCVLPSGCLCVFSFVFLALCFPFAPVKSARNEDVLYENGIVRHRGCPFCGILPADAGTLAQGIGTFSLGCWDTVADMTGHFSCFYPSSFPFFRASEGGVPLHSLRIACRNGKNRPAVCCGKGGFLPFLKAYAAFPCLYADVQMPAR